MHAPGEKGVFFMIFVPSAVPGGLRRVKFSKKSDPPEKGVFFVIFGPSAVPGGLRRVKFFKKIGPSQKVGVVGWRGYFCEKGFAHGSGGDTGSPTDQGQYGFSHDQGRVI